MLRIKTNNLCVNSLTFLFDSYNTCGSDSAFHKFYFKIPSRADSKMAEEHDVISHVILQQNLVLWWPRSTAQTQAEIFFRQRETKQNYSNQQLTDPILYPWMQYTIYGMSAY